MKIGIIGAGRLGICFALLCERAGYDVVVSDIRQDYVNDLQNKKIVTNEPGVQELLGVAENLRATTSNEEVIRECDIIYTLVATPSTSDGDYDVSAVWNVVEDIRTVLNDNDIEGGKAFIVGCTTNPGDCDDFAASLKGYGVDVFYNPEFIAQGSIISDLKRADMVLIGGENNEVYDRLVQLYYSIQGPELEPQISLMSRSAAELVKLAVNCYLTTKISYANMVGQVMALSGMADEIDNVLYAIGADSRVGHKYLKYGYGFGGPCLPRDNRAFAAYARRVGVQYNLGRVSDEINEEHSHFLTAYVEAEAKGLPIYFDYVSYKKGTDILTESQQLVLATQLLDKGQRVYITDIPAVIEKIEYDFTIKYGDRVRFVEPTEEVYRINL